MIDLGPKKTDATSHKTAPISLLKLVSQMPPNWKAFTTGIVLLVVQTFAMGSAVARPAGIPPYTVLSAQTATEFDVQVQQASLEEQQYQAQIIKERAVVEAYKALYEQKLLELCRPGTITHRSRQAANAREIVLLNRWLEMEREKEDQENAELNNLHGWTEYWLSRQRGVYQDQSWNASQAQIDAESAARQAAERARWQAMEAQTAAGTTYWHAQTGGIGYASVGRSYYGGHSYHPRTIHVRLR